MFNVFLVKTPTEYPKKLDKLTIKCVWKSRDFRIAKTNLKKKTNIKDLIDLYMVRYEHL